MGETMRSMPKNGKYQQKALIAPARYPGGAVV